MIRLSAHASPVARRSAPWSDLKTKTSKLWKLRTVSTGERPPSDRLATPPPPAVRSSHRLLSVFETTRAAPAKIISHRRRTNKPLCARACIWRPNNVRPSGPGRVVIVRRRRYFFLPVCGARERGPETEEIGEKTATKNRRFCASRRPRNRRKARE